MRTALALVLAAACGGPPSGVAPRADAEDRDASAPDAAPPDALEGALGPGLVFDDLHIASFTEDLHAFSVLGQALNPQLTQMVESGQLLLGIELRDLDDPSGASDAELTVGMYYLQDGDSPADPADNFDPDDPEVFRLGPGSMVGGAPTIHFTTASITSHRLHAEGAADLQLPGQIPLPLEDPVLDGTLEATDDGEHVRLLTSGRLRGAVPLQMLALLPNLSSQLGQSCPGQTMLDVLASGCGLLAVQPDVDLDGDGLEKLYDTASGDGGVKDGSIDRCVDGDGTVYEGAGCISQGTFADGYRLILVVHGVRAILLAP